MLSCSKCSGKVMGGVEEKGHVELFCIRCGKRWELHRDTDFAKIFRKLEQKRRLGIDRRS